MADAYDKLNQLENSIIELESQLDWLESHLADEFKSFKVTLREVFKRVEDVGSEIEAERADAVENLRERLLEAEEGE